MAEQEFYGIVGDILNSERFLAMKKYRHHVKSNVYAHSVRVAYLCYRHHKRHGTCVDLHEFVRGALLHDYYLYDWHEMLPGRRLHLFTHQKVALQNALRDYPGLSRMQQDMIRHHMFPIVPLPPRTKAGWLVCFYDKVAAFADYFEKKNIP